MRADLHIHTIASDGRWTPEQVVVEVQARGIGLFAVTDHDTVASVCPAEELARDASSHGGFVGRTLGVPVVDTADLRLGELEACIVR